jgi:hypothetical protein
VLESRHRILAQRSSPLLDAIKPHNNLHFKSFSTGSTPGISGGALSSVPWHFISHRPLHAVVMLLAPGLLLSCFTSAAAPKLITRASR